MLDIEKSIHSLVLIFGSLISLHFVLCGLGQDRDQAGGMRLLPTANFDHHPLIVTHQDYRLLRTHQVSETRSCWDVRTVYFSFFSGYC